MIPYDGTYTMYCLEHFYKEEEWMGVSFDVFGTPHEAFSAGGRCWQETRVHGAYDLEDAVEGLRTIERQHPECEFRLVKITLSRKTEEVDTYKGKGGGI